MSSWDCFWAVNFLRVVFWCLFYLFYKLSIMFLRSIILLWNDDCQVEISHSFDFRFFRFFLVFSFFSTKNTGQETSIQIYCRLATLLFVDWLPQVNGFVASFFVYSRESNLWNKKCLHRFVLNNFNHLLIEKKVRLLLFLKL